MNIANRGLMICSDIFIQSLNSTLESKALT